MSKRTKQQIMPLIVSLVLLTTAPTLAGKIIYVDSDALGANNGSSWTDAYNFLLEALTDADSSPKPIEIRVAKGTYRPDEDTDYPDGTGGQSRTFRLSNAVTIKGGYAGFGQSDPNVRDIRNYETILSGDLGGGWRSYHVVTALEVDANAVLDGFTITGGYAYGRDTYPYGAGVYISRASSPRLMNCTITKNETSSRGGGMYIGEDSNAMIVNCIFTDNKADHGGGIWNYFASPTLINCVFAGNQADDGDGGGIDNYTHGRLTLINCTFSNNTAIWKGGGIQNSYSTTLTMTNCILWNNKDRHGMDESAQIDGAMSAINYCGIQGWTGALGGFGNMGNDPLLVDPDRGNCRLWPESPYINAGENSAVPPSVVTDVDGNPRIVDGTVDMGAYELQHPPILYVDVDATGANNGSSWADAYNFLQDALTAASRGNEIWVAQGTYRPDQGAEITPGDRTATFQLNSLVTIKGGYAGLGEPDPNERDIDAYETILSGDLNGDDRPHFVNYGENSYHVVNANETDASAVLDGVTITSGNADGSYLDKYNRGAGIYSTDSLTLSNCTIIGNSASSYSPTAWAPGGGMYSEGIDSIAVLTNCTFISNSAGDGGGLYIGTWAHPTLTNCTFIGNSARDDGGGIFNGGSCKGSTSLTNCTFIGNSAGDEGGGIQNWGYALSTSLTNCLFTGNSAIRGGGMSNGFRSTAILTNCTFSGNSAYYGNALWCETQPPDPDYPNSLHLINCILRDGGDETWKDDNSSISMAYSNIQGGWPGTGNIDADPLFVNDDGMDNEQGTADDNLRLLGGSVCLDRGTNVTIPSLPPTDLDGKARIANGIVDMGAYEGPEQGFVLSAESVTVPEDGYQTFTVALAMNPLGPVEVTAAFESGDPDVIVQAGTSLIFNSSNYRQPQTVTLAAGEDDDYINGKAIIFVSAPGLTTVDIAAREVDNESVPDILHVDATAQGNNSGASWADAFTDLQEALSVAAATAGVKEVRVAHGLFKPDGRSGDRFESFRLINGVAVKGGYAGLRGPDPNARNLREYETVLSGDLGGNDVGGLNDPSRDDNSFHVVVGRGVDANAVLDGFTITAGNANGDCYSNSCGGGMLNWYCRARLVNCTFTGNWAQQQGGAMYNYSRSTPEVMNCTFKCNSAGSDGGAVQNYGHCYPILTNCLFIGNSAQRGSALCNYQSQPTLTNCILWDNLPGAIKGSATVVYSNVQGGRYGEGNIDADPLFIEPGYWDANGVWIDGDYHLLPDSPCIDAGDPNYMAEPNETDLDGKPRVLDGDNDGVLVVDMGAYEYRFTISAEARIVPQTINLASKGNWITCYIWLPEEYDVADIDPNSIFLESKIQPEQFSLNEDQQVAIAKFNRDKVQAILDVGEIELTITGQLTDGTVFEATDKIKVIDKTGKN